MDSELYDAHDGCNKYCSDFGIVYRGVFIIFSCFRNHYNYCIDTLLVYSVLDCFGVNVASRYIKYIDH